MGGARISRAGSKKWRDTQGMKLELLPVGDIVPDPHNPRIHDREQIRAIARGIETFGFNAPILVDGNKRIVAGHGRHEAAKLLKRATAPVIRLAHQGRSTDSYKRPPN